MPEIEAPLQEGHTFDGFIKRLSDMLSDVVPTGALDHGVHDMVCAPHLVKGSRPLAELFSPTSADRGPDLGVATVSRSNGDDGRNVLVRLWRGLRRGDWPRLRYPPRGDSCGVSY